MPQPVTCRDDATAPDLDVGVIYTHERSLMPRLLTTLRGAGEGLRMRLLLVDNHSADGAGQWSGYVHETLVIPNARRLGYATNLNRVLRQSTARYVLLMNTDMYFDPRGRCLTRMVEFMDRQTDCGVAGCRLLHADGADAFAARRMQTLPLILARRLGLARVLQGTVDRHFYREHAPDATFACDWLSGCFLLVRRAALRDVGEIDESFGKYFEDVDLCLRMARAGWGVMYHGAAACYHLEQRASKKLLSIDAWRHLRAYLRWLRKWGYAPEPATVPPNRKAA